jgi:hypothetical protein
MARRRVSETSITSEQRANLLARVYLTGAGRPFESEAARRAAWVANRDQLLAEARPGLRPGAWWQYEAPEAEAQRQLVMVDGVGCCHESDRELLGRLDLLSAEEAGILASAEKAALEKKRSKKRGFRP